MGRGYLVVEGHGDGQAALNLIRRLWDDLRLPTLHWADPIRGKNLHQERGVQKVGQLVRSKPDVAALLLLRDEDDGCPKVIAPHTATWVRGLRLPFPSAVILAHREYEAFFLPCVPIIAGRKLKGPPDNLERPGLIAGSVFHGNPEDIRGVKEWLSAHMPAGHSYKPTVDQLPMTRMIDFTTLRQSEPPLPCFGSLERALSFLAEQIRTNKRETYPPWKKLP